MRHNTVMKITHAHHSSLRTLPKRLSSPVLLPVARPGLADNGGSRHDGGKADDEVHPLLVESPASDLIQNTVNVQHGEG